jgi:membrane protein
LGFIGTAVGVLKGTVLAFLEDDVVHWGASLAYYSLISLAPLVVLAMTILGKVLGRGEAEHWILDQVRLLAGPRGQELASTVLGRASQPELGSWGAILTVGLLLFGATAVFTNLQGALNRIWEVKAGSRLIRNVARTRVASFAMVLCLGGLLVLSVVASALMSWIGPLLDPIGSFLPLVRIGELFTSILLLWVFVSAAFKILPDVKVSWRDVWIGALATALLLYLGKYALALFLARNAFASLYGAAGSLFLLLVWIYFSAQAFFFGAEFTQVWARTRGRQIEPEDYAFRTEIVEVKEEG